MELLTELNNRQKIDFKACVEIAKQFKIKFKFENDNFDRLLFFTERKITQPNNVNIYCNGLIAEKGLDGWKFTCNPMPNFLDKKLMVQDEYYIHPITESTIINAYYSGEWKFATRKSFDCYNSVWRGVKYSEMLEGIEKFLVDKETTYIFALTNKKIHLFSNKDETRLVATCKGGIFEYYDNQEDQPNIVEKCKTALDEFVKKGTINFGFIIRNTENKCFMFKSTLLEEIEKYAYRAPFVKKGQKNRNQKIKQIENINFVIINCYLRNPYLTAKLFRFEKQFELLGAAKKYACANILNILNNGKRGQGALFNALEKFYMNNYKVFEVIGKREFKKKMIENFIEDCKDFSFYNFVLENPDLIKV